MTMAIPQDMKCVCGQIGYVAYGGLCFNCYKIQQEGLAKIHGSYGTYGTSMNYQDRINRLENEVEALKFQLKGVTHERDKLHSQLTNIKRLCAWREPAKVLQQIEEELNK